MSCSCNEKSVILCQIMFDAISRIWYNSSCEKRITVWSFMHKLKAGFDHSP